MGIPAQNLHQQSSYKTLLILMCFLTLSLAVLITVLISQTFKKKTPTPQPIVNTVQPSPASEQTIVWKTYKNNEMYKYEISYLSNWAVYPSKSFYPTDPDEGAVFLPPGKHEGREPYQLIGEGAIILSCPRGSNEAKIELPNPAIWVPNGGGYEPYNLKNIALNSMKGVQYIWGTDDTGGTLHTSLLRNSDPLVCELSISISRDKKESYEDAIKKLDVYNQMLSTFKFLPSQQTIDTSNWKTHTDPTYKYSFRYPPDWTLISAKTGSTLLHSWPPEKPPVGRGLLPSSEIQLEFSVFANPDRLNAKQWHQNVTSYDSIVKQEFLKVNGVQAVRSTWKSGIATVDFADGDKMYTILGPVNSRYLPEFDQILQTFKFTE